MWKCAAPAWIKAEVRFGKWFSADSLIEGLSVIGAGDVREPWEGAGRPSARTSCAIAVQGAVARSPRGVTHKAGALCTQSGGFVALAPRV